MQAISHFGQLPDRLGGARVALFFIVVETMGLALMWLAWSGPVAALGAALTGFGYALVYPGFGVEAVSEASEEARGVAMAAYTACLDVALGVSGPVLGLVASVSGLPVVFLVSAVAVLCSAIVALLILRQKAARPA
ncbi:MFS transporter [Bosea sp. 47.2.35]|uniref:MFS transporter n=1 Tax=Bosea sp. 47.2.35 TaxID=2969304 RepID=UPI00214FA2BC|nr:MFS transporter [Bosea sp. 47.2.35]MCR4523003.1 MFS transporter [Bosea sp. 47.2.35]